MNERNKAIIRLLLKAKAAGDTRAWDRKAGLSREALRAAPGDFYEDSRESHIVGLTHKPTGFRFHLPKNQIQSFELNKEDDMTNQELNTLKAGCFSIYKQAGLPKGLWESMFKQAGYRDWSPDERRAYERMKNNPPKPTPPVKKVAPAPVKPSPVPAPVKPSPAPVTTPNPGPNSFMDPKGLTTNNPSIKLPRK